jgi:hypothetical protein
MSLSDNCITLIIDGEKNFKLKYQHIIEELAEENGKRVRRHESIQRHIYYYNFEEMNYPPRYPEAKSGNKFRLF